jgi:hypothetical protein
MHWCIVQSAEGGDWLVRGISARNIAKSWSGEAGRQVSEFLPGMNHSIFSSGKETDKPAPLPHLIC